MESSVIHLSENWSISAASVFLTPTPIYISNIESQAASGYISIDNGIQSPLFIKFIRKGTIVKDILLNLHESIAFTALNFDTITITPRILVYVANNLSNSMSVIDAETNQVIGTINGIVGSPIVSPIGVAANPVANMVYISNSGNDTVSLINSITNAVVLPSVSVGDEPFAVAVTPSGTHAYVTNFNSGTVSVINLSTNMLIATINLNVLGITNARPVGVVITPNGKYAYASGFNTFGASLGSVSVIDTATNSVVQQIEVTAQPDRVAITPDGTKLYVTHAFPGNTVSVISTLTNTVINSLIVGNNPLGVAIMPNGSKAYVVNNGNNNVSIINVASDTVEAGIIAVGNLPVEVAFTPDGLRAYVTNGGESSVTAIDTATLATTSIIVGNQPFGVAVSPPRIDKPLSGKICLTIRLKS